MIFRLIFSTILGITFFISAIPKLRYPKGFILSVLEYRVLPVRSGYIYGWLLPPVELLVALLLLSGTNVRLAAFIILLLLLSFIIAVSLNMRRGRDLDCHCFGSKKWLKVGWALLLQDSILFGFAAMLTFYATSWSGLETWSVFLFLGPLSAYGLAPFFVCAGITISAVFLLRISPHHRKWDATTVSVRGR